ncbi:MAG TPA: cyclic-di-AMP receptor [Thermomicrobiales bacterium]|nr:cyclic-di-AMP receptor [Thermomicrobiales bacterium]
MKKLIIAVVQNEDADAVVDALLEQEFRATRLASTGGFLRRGNTTLMIGADEEQVDQVLGLIREHATMAAAPEGSGATQPAAATVFVLDLEEYQRL